MTKYHAEVKLGPVYESTTVTIETESQTFLLKIEAMVKAVYDEMRGEGLI